MFHIWKIQNFSLLGIFSAWNILEVSLWIPDVLWLLSSHLRGCVRCRYYTIHPTCHSINQALSLLSPVGLVCSNLVVNILLVCGVNKDYSGRNRDLRYRIEKKLIEKWIKQYRLGHIRQDAILLSIPLILKNYKINDGGTNQQTPWQRDRQDIHIMSPRWRLKTNL